MDTAKVGCIVLIGIAFLTGCARTTETSEIVDSVSSWQEQYDLGIHYLDEGNYAEAIIAFTAAIEIDQSQASAYVGRGNAYMGSGLSEANIVAARADFEYAIELDEVSADAYLGIADIYIRTGDIESAIGVLKKGYLATGDSRIAERLEPLVAQPHAMHTVSENGGNRITYGQEDLNGELQGFCVVNEFDADGKLIWLSEAEYEGGKYTDGNVVKNYWHNPEKSEYGIASGYYQNGVRNGHNHIRCYEAIEYPNADGDDIIRFEDLQGVSLYYEYDGNLVEDVVEDDTGEAYMMWLDAGYIVEYTGQFAGGTRSGYGRMWSTGGGWERKGYWENGQFIG